MFWFQILAIVSLFIHHILKAFCLFTVVYTSVSEQTYLLEFRLIMAQAWIISFLVPLGFVIISLSFHSSATQEKIYTSISNGPQSYYDY